MREIRTSGSVGGEAGVEQRDTLSGHEGGNAGHRQAWPSNQLPPPYPDSMTIRSFGHVARSTRGAR